MSYKKISLSNHGFTLIELLIAIAIVAIIAVVAFVALDPARRFRESRNAKRWTDVTALVDAIKLYQVDLRGALPWPASGAGALTNGTSYMLGSCTGAGCTAKACTSRTGANAISAVTTVALNLTLLTSGTPSYMAALPISPTDPTLTPDWTTVMTGYYLVPNANGSVEVGACDQEPAGTVISVTK